LKDSTEKAPETGEEKKGSRENPYGTARPVTTKAKEKEETIVEEKPREPREPRQPRDNRDNRDNNPRRQSEGGNRNYKNNSNSRTNNKWQKQNERPPTRGGQESWSFRGAKGRNKRGGGYQGRPSFNMKKTEGEEQQENSPFTQNHYNLLFEDKGGEEETNVKETNDKEEERTSG